MSVINLIDGESQIMWTNDWRVARLWEHLRSSDRSELTLRQLVTNGETSSHEVANNFSKLLHSETQNTFQRTLKVESCFYRWKFCHHILFRNQITPIDHFLFIMRAFRLISNTKLLFRLKAWVCKIAFYDPEKVFEFTFLTSAVFIHCCSSFKENIINVVSIFSQNIERVLTKHLLLFSSECNKLTWQSLSN